MEETGEPGENHRPVASHWQTLSQCCIEYTSPLAGFKLTMLVVIGKSNYHVTMRVPLIVYGLALSLTPLLWVHALIHLNDKVSRYLLMGWVLYVLGSSLKLVVTHACTLLIIVLWFYGTNQTHNSTLWRGHSRVLRVGTISHSLHFMDPSQWILISSVHVA